MSEQVFADGIGPIVVVGGTVRLDFITFVPNEGEGGARPKAEVQHRLFMPIDAFVMTARRFAEAADAIGKLEQKGAPIPAAPEPHPVEPPPAAPETAMPAIPTQPIERTKPPFP